MAQRKSQRQTAPGPRRPSAMWAMIFAALLVAIGVSGLNLVQQAHEMRGLYGALGKVQRQQDELLEEHSRLMLERGALSSMQQIEVVAETELDMHFPDDIGEVLE